MSIRDETPEDLALSKAKIALMARRDSMFYTTVLFNMKISWNDEIDTARVNGLEIQISRRFFMELDAEERVTLLVHECMHPAYMHLDPERSHGKDHGLWNVAGDYRINYDLVSRGFKLPKMGLYDAKYADMTTEEIYAALPPNTPPPPMDDLQISGEGDPATPEIQAKIAEILVQAQLQSKLAEESPGAIPGEIQVMLEKLLNPKLPWQKILHREMTAFAKNDYSFRKFNRRYLPQVYLPTLYSENLNKIAIAVDASGSVEDSEFTRFVSETHGILRMLRPKEIQLIQFDSTIKSVDRVRSIAELARIQFHGRGGTRIEPVLQWAEQHKPQILLVFSDGHFHFRQTECKVKTLWLIHDYPKFTAPFGKVIHYQMHS